MKLPAPNLDDRTWDDIVEEAKDLIPFYCPHWTDFNPADPGITLLELMAWLAEMIIYRLNRVPDKNYIKFMELIGTGLQPPKPANAWLEFTPAPGAASENLPHIPANTRVSGTDPSGERITFETVDALTLNGSRLKKIFTQLGERYTDRSQEFLSGVPSRRYNIFKGKNEIPHVLYLGDPALEQTGDDFSLRLYVELEKAGPNLKIQWSYWDGNIWRAIAPLLDETAHLSKSGEILFPHLPRAGKRKISQYDNFWLRLHLKEYSGGILPRIRSLTKALELKKKAGIVPDRGFLSTELIPFQPVQFQRVMRPFGTDGKENDTLYISSEAFTMTGIPVTIDIALAESYTPSKIDILAELEVYWEYYKQSGEWDLLGITSYTNVSDSRWGFKDGTVAFTHSGKVVFYVPDDIIPLELLGERRYWIRIRIHKGNYGTGKKINPPVCAQFLIHYREKPGNFQYCLAYNEFELTDLTADITAKKEVQPFVPAAEPQPLLYLGFDKPFTNTLHRIYIRLVRRGKWESRVTWEYHSPDGWKPLKLHLDTTGHFTGIGVVEFIGPADWTTQRKFGHQAYWLRVKWNEYRLRPAPRLRSLHLNMVKALHAVSFKNETLGSGDGQPFQWFRLLHAPILPDPAPRILVRELESTFAEERQKFKESLKEEVVEEIDPASDDVKALWVVWQERDNFYNSTHNCRHYLLDTYRGTITFGDGIKGRIPPIGKENIKCEIYYNGAGSEGNVGKNKLKNLERAFPYVDKVTNPYPAAGGADMETIADAKLRAPWTLKHRSRAVTGEDFEKLALEATGEVARALCWSSQEGIIKILIIPGGIQPKPVPSDALRDTVRQYLDQRRLITSKIEILGPLYLDFSIHAEIALEQEMADQGLEIKTRIEIELKQFFHPLSGGLHKDGWPMGRTVHRSEIYYVIENIPGVDYVSHLTFDRTPGKDKIDIAETAFPFLKKIDITISGG